ncbi:HTH-type transcriptional repressor CytR [Enterobacter cloacae]|uniref:HTH-type transcriptional repressor CytR n=1 Tax=Enterobacter cloacae TaxID=550 RepID=A0A377M6J4_ENTCL|nr:HTH-type transcriptional repressor CytR [Enterobacter cloacae]
MSRVMSWATEAVHMLQQRLMRPEAPSGTLLLNGTLTVRNRSADTSGETTHRR